MEEKPLFGLCMIVKNEEHVIERAMRSALRMMNTFCIVDTGSTDKTKEIIQKVADELGIKGFIYDRPWVNFGVNRTEALELAKKHMKWGFMLDADDSIEGGMIDTTLLKDDIAGYLININHGYIVHHRIHIFNLNYDWEYVGALHEYPNCKSIPIISIKINESTYIEARVEGGRSKDPQKYLRDALILQKELDTNPNCDKARTLFYLAQSYKDAGLNDIAKKYYLKRAEFDGWKEENYISYLALIRFSHDIEEKLKYAWKAQNLVPDRKECVYEVLSYARKKDIFTKEIYALGLLFKDVKININHLFVESFTYDWAYFDEFGIQAYYNEYYNESYKACKIAIQTCPDEQKIRIQKNIDFCLPYINNGIELIYDYKIYNENKIPKILFQTAKNRIPLYVKDINKKYLTSEWKYLEFNDNEIIEFFKDNPLNEFSNIINIFNSIKSGPHKADIFRLYFIYINGGVFLDDDAILTCNINNIIRDYTFFSVQSTYDVDSIFQGLIGATAKNPLIYECLKSLYECNLAQYDNFHLYTTKDMYKIIKDTKHSYELYTEKYYDDNTTKLVNNENLIIAKHYWRNKIIPNNLNDNSLTIIATMTTIPSRINEIKHTIESVLNQSIRIKHLEINIPYKCIRTNEEYIIPEWLNNMERVKIYRTEDYGSITKVAPTFIRYKDNPDIYIWSVDDDLIYPNNTLELYTDGYSKFSNEARGYYHLHTTSDMNHLDNVILLQGFSSILYSPQIIKDDFINYLNIIVNSDKCKNDDIMIGNYLAKYNISRILYRPYNIEFLNNNILQQYGDKEDALKNIYNYYDEYNIVCLKYLKENNILYLFDYDSNIYTVYKSPFKKIRIGSKNDGGYIICHIPNMNYDLILGCGVENNLDFENEFLSKYSYINDCFVFDGTIDKIPESNNKIKWIKKNISSKNTDTTTNLDDYINKYNNVFLKMDIEGHEIEWLETLNTKQIDNLSQIVIEFHYPFSPRESAIFSKLNKTHVLLHLHGNNNAGIRKYNNINLPEVFECTYVNKKHIDIDLELNNEKLPCDLDAPNNKDAKDIDLNYKPFVNI
jgi:hypothetical protein